MRWLRLTLHSRHVMNETWTKRCILCTYDKVLFVDTPPVDYPDVMLSRLRAMGAVIR